MYTLLSGRIIICFVWVHCQDLLNENGNIDGKSSGDCLLSIQIQIQSIMRIVILTEKVQAMQRLLVCSSLIRTHIAWWSLLSSQS